MEIMNDKKQVIKGASKMFCLNRSRFLINKLPAFYALKSCAFLKILFCMRLHSTSAGATWLRVPALAEVTQTVRRNVVRDLNFFFHFFYFSSPK